jgi:hypothetical protein
LLFSSLLFAHHDFLILVVLRIGEREEEPSRQAGEFEQLQARSRCFVRKMTVATAYRIPRWSKETFANVRSLLKICILGCIAAAACSSRLFAVINFESIIHEFDPWCARYVLDHPGSSDRP